MFAFLFEGPLIAETDRKLVDSLIGPVPNTGITSGDHPLITPVQTDPVETTLVQTIPEVSDPVETTPVQITLKEPDAVSLDTNSIPVQPLQVTIPTKSPSTGMFPLYYQYTKSLLV